MKLREISKKEFEDFCDDVQEKNIFQSKEWAEVKRRFGYHTYFVMTFKKKTFFNQRNGLR